MADLITFTDELTTEYSYMFNYATDPNDPTKAVVIGWNPDFLDRFISNNRPVDLFIPEFVNYEKEQLYIKGISSEAFTGENDVNDVILKQFNRQCVRTLHLPEGIEYIGDKAFYNCQLLSYVNFPSTLKRLEGKTFSYCSALQTKCADGQSDAPTPGYLRIPWTVESIAKAFQYCESLTIVEIGDSSHGSNLDTNNNEFTFKGCSNLKIFRYFYKNLEISFSGSCFEDCTNLTTVETPLGHIKSIGNKAFYNCQSLNNIAQMEPVIDQFTGNVIYNYSGVTIGSEAFKNCISLFRLPFQSEIISLGANAFQGCYYLQEINLGNTLTEIPEGAFAGCSSLGSITIPKNCTRIGVNAFNSCSRLRDVFIPSQTLEYIEEGAFNGCSNLQRLWLLATNYNDIIFSGSPFGDYTVNPNKSLILNSVFTQNWDESDFVDFETAFNTYWQVSATRETILFTPPTNINPDGLTFILELNRPTFNSLTGTAALVGIVNQSAIETSIIDLPDSVTSNGRTYTINKIGDDAFAYNYRISKIRIPNTITEIGNKAFENCVNLEEISSITSVSNFPITKIGNGAFAHTKLSKINSTENKLNNLQYIGKDAFIGCNSLGKINLGTNYNGPIPERAFAHCGNLQVSKKSTTSYITQSTSTRYDNTTFFATTPTFVNI